MQQVLGQGGRGRGVMECSGGSVHRCVGETCLGRQIRTNKCLQGAMRSLMQQSSGHPDNLLLAPNTHS